MATMVPPQKGVEYITTIGLVSQADTKLLQTNPTLAAGDVLVSTDHGATSNLDTLPAVTPAGGKAVKVTVSAAEMNGDNIDITFSDVAGSEWCDHLINIQTSAQSLDTIHALVDAIKAVTDTVISAAALVDAIFDEDVETSHQTAGTAGKKLDDAETDTNELQAKVTTLLNRLTAARAGYLDELEASNIPADIDTLKVYCDILDDATNGLVAIRTVLGNLPGAVFDLGR